MDLRDETERTEKTRAALKLLVDTRRHIERAGLPVNIVSGGGTGTYTLTGDYEGIDEVQAGSYAAMDWYYQDIRPEFRQAQTILTTVISRPAPTWRSLMSAERGLAENGARPESRICVGRRW